VGNWVLWVAVEEDELLGAAVTEVLTTERGLYCNVPFAWSKDPRKNIYKDFLDYVEISARKYGFKGIKFFSSRPGFARHAARLGYQKGFVEYKKEFE
jgi:hypothetical protein